MSLEVEGWTHFRFESIVLTMTIVTFFSEATFVWTVFTFVSIDAFPVYFFESGCTSTLTRGVLLPYPKIESTLSIDISIIKTRTIAFIRSHRIYTVLTLWAVLVWIGMIALVNVSTAVVVNLFVSRQTLTRGIAAVSCLTNRTRNCSGLTVQHRARHLLANTLTVFHIEPFVTLARELAPIQIDAHLVTYLVPILFTHTASRGDVNFCRRCGRPLRRRRCCCRSCWLAWHLYDRWTGVNGVDAARQIRRFARFGQCNCFLTMAILGILTAANLTTLTTGLSIIACVWIGRDRIIATRAQLIIVPVTIKTVVRSASRLTTLSGGGRTQWGAAKGLGKLGRYTAAWFAI